MALNFAKLDKFEGVGFRRWQSKMQFFLSSMSVVYVLTTPILEDGGDDATMEKLKKRAMWDNDYYVCRGSHLHIKESLKVLDSDKPKGNNVVGPSVVNMVKHNNSSRNVAKLVTYHKGVNVGKKSNGSCTKVLVDGSSNSLKAFKSKTKLNDSILWHARLGHVQFKRMQGIDYFDTYAPVACISTIRMLIAMALIYNLVIHQMDVKRAFLNGDLDKEAPKQWHQTFDEVVLSNGYLLNQANKCVYRKLDESDKGVVIFLYVDDMLIFDTNQVQHDLTKEFLSSRFSMKDMRRMMLLISQRLTL
nr:zinc finger, CCHC-type [Tanacetum cinerariifolium]